MDLIYFIAGLVILGFAGEATLRGAVGLAQRLNISPAMIGLTVVGLGTSLPELVVCVEAALDGKPDLAVGNIVGSNISNILLILGVGAHAKSAHMAAYAAKVKDMLEDRTIHILESA